MASKHPGEGSSTQEAPSAPISPEEELRALRSKYRNFEVMAVLSMDDIHKQNAPCNTNARLVNPFRRHSERRNNCHKGRMHLLKTAVLNAAREAADERALHDMLDAMMAGPPAAAAAAVPAHDAMLAGPPAEAAVPAHDAMLVGPPAAAAVAVPAHAAMLAGPPAAAAVPAHAPAEQHGAAAAPAHFPVHQHAYNCQPAPHGEGAAPPQREQPMDVEMAPADDADGDWEPMVSALLRSIPVAEAAADQGYSAEEPDPWVFSGELADLDAW